MGIHVVQTLPEEEWHCFVEEHPAGNIFHTPEMFQVFARTKGYQPSLWAAVDQSKRPLALLLPVQITLKGGLLARLTTRAVVYGSVLCAPDPEGKEALGLLLETYKREIKGSILFTELRNLSDLSDLQPVLNGCGFAYEEHLNFLLDLTRPQEGIWQNIRSNARRNIRKARKLQVVIEEVNDPHRIPAIYALLKEIYQRIQVPLADVSFFQSAFEILHPQDMMRVFVAKAEDGDIGVLTLLLYKDIVYYWYTGTLREYASYRAGDLLVWHTLEWGNQNGFRVLDFGGAGRPNEEYGVRDFKAKFGGRLVNYGRNVHVHAPVTFQVSKAVYQTARRFLYRR
jgi:serine/alanine adding enzyme